MSANGTTPTLAVALPDEVLEQVAVRAAELVAECPAAPEPWLNVEQAAAHLAISTSQLYTLCPQRRRNGLPVIKEGSRSYFKAPDLDAWRGGGNHADNGHDQISDRRITRL